MCVYVYIQYMCTTSPLVKVFFTSLRKGIEYSTLHLRVPYHLCNDHLFLITGNTTVRTNHTHCHPALVSNFQFCNTRKAFQRVLQVLLSQKPVRFHLHHHSHALFHKCSLSKNGKKWCLISIFLLNNCTHFTCKFLSANRNLDGYVK